MRVLLTGATGFVGRALMPHLLRGGLSVRAAVRSIADDLPDHVEQFPQTRLEFDDPTPWEHALEGCEAVIHAAGLAHVPLAADSEDRLKRINVNATVRLAELAAKTGCKRIVFISSAKVHGEETTAEAAFRESDSPEPADAYGKAKLQAEQRLMALSQTTGLEVTVVRPPLVVGPGARGNLSRIMRLVRSGIPLPLSAIGNRRTLVGVDNLSDLILRCATHPDAANEVFLAGDAPDMAAPQLVRLLADAMNRKARLFPVPTALLETAATLAGKGDEVKKLTRSLRVDSSKAREVLGWHSREPLETALAQMAQAHLDAQ